MEDKHTPGTPFGLLLRELWAELDFMVSAIREELNRLGRL
jgi:hypothetical protein